MLMDAMLAASTLHTQLVALHNSDIIISQIGNSNNTFSINCCVSCYLVKYPFFFTKYEIY